MGKRIILLKGEDITKLLREKYPLLPSDIKVLHSTTRMEYPGVVRLLCASEEWPIFAEGERIVEWP